MSDKDTSGLQVVRKEEKEARVAAFIERHIRERETQGSAGPIEYLLVARSPESPVCRALSALAPALAAQQISIRIVFTAVDGGIFQGDMAASGALMQAATIRIISDFRLYEAHEQLVLDEETCWIGDCMRREPAKRDAYESYQSSSAEAARAATLAFGNLWRVGSPTAAVSRSIQSMGFKDSQDPSVFSGNVPGGDQTLPTAATRH